MGRLANYLRSNSYGLFTVGATTVNQLPNQVVSSFTYTPSFTTTQTFTLQSTSPLSIGAGTFDSIGTFDNASSTTEQPTTILTTTHSTTPGNEPVPNPFITITPELSEWLDGKIGV